MPTLPKVLVVLLLVLVAVAPVGAVTFLQERFNGATFPPAGWTVVDNGGSGVVWTNVAGSLEAGNYTSGSGDAASVSRDLAGQLNFDTELRTPSILLPGGTDVVLHFLANYQDRVAFADLLQADFSTNGGTAWVNLENWSTNHGEFRAQPGECVDVDLSAMLPVATSLMIRFRYFNSNSFDFGWYAQIDDVVVDDQLTSPCPRFRDGFESGDSSAWSSTVPRSVALTARGELRREIGERGGRHRAEAETTGRGQRHDRRRRWSKPRADGLLPTPPEHRAPPPASAPPGR